MSSKKKCSGDCSGCKCKTKESATLDFILKALSAGIGMKVDATVVNLPKRKPRRNKDK